MRIKEQETRLNLHEHDDDDDDDDDDDKYKNCWSFTKVILRCMVSKTKKH